MTTTLIKNGLVYDGSGKQPEKKDILIKGEWIVGIGSFSKKDAQTVLDASGMDVYPGFIDINTTSDHYLTLFTEPFQEDFVRQGVTTIIGGNCGASLAPILNGSLNSIRRWGSPAHINLNWRSVAEFLKILKKRGLGVNFGTLVGHSTIRRALIGEDLRDLTQRELNAFKRILEKAFREGAFGFSTGLSFVHSKRTPYYEIKELAEIAGKWKRVYATHIRDNENALASLEETLSIGREAEVNLEISHFLPIKNHDEDYLKALELIEKESAQSHINFDVYPFEFSSVPAYSFLPKWAQDGDLEIMAAHVLNPHLRQRLLAHFRQFSGQEIIILHTNDSTLKFLEGITLKDFAERREISFGQGFLKFMQLVKLKATLLYRNVDGKILNQFLASSPSIIASNSPGLKNYSVFPKFLKLAAEGNLMPLSKALQKITSLPAQKYNIRKRGLIKDGYYADIAVSREGRIYHTIINGVSALREGNLEKKLAGKILKRE